MISPPSAPLSLAEGDGRGSGVKGHVVGVDDHVGRNCGPTGGEVARGCGRDWETTEPTASKVVVLMPGHHGGGTGEGVKVHRLGTAAECAASRGRVVIVGAGWAYPLGGHGHFEW